MEKLNNKENNRGLVFLTLCFFAAYLLPYHFRPFSAFYNDWLAIFGVVIAFAYCIEYKKMPLQVPWIALLPLSLGGVIVLQTAMGMLSERWDAFLPIGYLLVCALAIVLGANIAGHPDGSSRLCKALAIAHLLAGLVSVAIASMQLIGAEVSFAPFLMIAPRGPNILIRPYANIGQPNQLALLLCISVASVWWLFQAGKVRPLIAIAAVLALLWGLALTQSRIGWIIIPLFALTNWVYKGGRDFRAMPTWFTVGLVLVYAAFIIALPTFSSLLGVPTASAVERVGSGSTRAILFQQALHISLSHPWFGAGWFQFGPQQLAIASNFPVGEYANHSHNIVLNFAAELGWPITIIVFCVLSYWLIRSYLSRPLDKQVGFALLFFMAALVHSLVEYPLWYAYVLAPLALLIGMVHEERFKANEILLPRRYAMTVLIIFSCGLLAVGMDYRRAVNGFDELTLQTVGLKFDEKAMNKPQVTIFPYVYDYFKFMHIKVRKDMPSEEIAFMERTARRFGGALVLTRMSQVYALNGREDDAVKAMLTIQHLHASRYKDAYEEWRHAPKQYEEIFRRLPVPPKTTNESTKATY